MHSSVSATFIAVVILLQLCCAPLGQCQIVNYPLNENEGDTAFDTSENANNGSIIGPVWAAGKYNYALHFDGQNDRIAIDNLDIPSSAMTIITWVKADSFPGTNEDPRIISKAIGNSEQDHYWMLSAIKDSDYRLRFRLKTDGQTSTLVGPALSTGVWTHIAATYDGQYMRIYKNGVETHNLEKSGTIDTDESIPTWIGDQPPNSGARPWHGMIDDIKIFDRALSAEEIQQIIDNGNTNQPPIVAITQPIDGATITPGGSVTINVDAHDNDGSVGAVQLLVNGEYYAQDVTSPYSFTFNNAADGLYTFTATGEDGHGTVTTSNPVSVTANNTTANPRDITWVYKSTTTSDLDTPTASGDEQTASLVLDINNDNITDFVITDRSQSPSVVWYESSGAGSWTRHIIDNTLLPIEAGGAQYDIDSDGDLDIVMGGDYQSNQVWWWENPSPNFTGEWTRRLIKNSGSKKHHDMIFGDFDGDGQTELVFWNQNANKLFISDIPVDPRSTSTWQQTQIYSWSSGPEHEGLAKADIDNDGQIDIIGGGRWFKHNGGSSFTANIIDASQTFGRVAAGQLIAGGYPEVVLGPGDNVNVLAWYSYNGSTWTKHIIRSGVDHGHSLSLADFDDDGMLDIFNAEMRLNGGNPDAKTWVFFNNGDGSFTETVVGEGYGNHESKPADLDGDGDIDLLVKPFNFDAPRLDIFLNNGTGVGSGSLLAIDKWVRHQVDSAMPANAVFVEAGDLNGDGLTDLAAGGWWYQNGGTLDSPWTRHTIGSPLNNTLLLSDFDDDGDLDILGSQGIGSNANNEFAWARNDGAGDFAVLTNIDTGGTGDFVQGRVLCDFGFGPLVALSWHNGGGGVHGISIPANPSTTNWPFFTFSTTTQSEDLSAGDIDRDGDLDLLLGSIWLRNSTSPPNAVTIGSIDDLDADALPDRNDLADINGDGRLDAVVAFEKGTHILWFEAPADPIQPWTRHIVGNVEGQGFSMDVADFDNDGQPDIVIGEHRGVTDNRVIIFRNVNKGQSFSPVVIDTDSVDVIDHHDGTQAIDLDNDGDLDLISVGWYNKKVWVYENKAIDGQPQPDAYIEATHVFYNNSAWDNNDPAANADDDNAIAPDKTTLEPSAQPTFENYTSFVKGITGLMIDIKNLRSLPTVDDFEFRIGNNSSPDTWLLAPAPQEITMRDNAGVNSAHRVTITWADGAITRRWLRVIIKPSANTGLALEKTLYIGNAIGDVGDQVGNANVDATDIIECRNNPRNFINPAGLTDTRDFDRDKKVDATDIIIARNNTTTFLNALKLQPLP